MNKTQEAIVFIRRYIIEHNGTCPTLPEIVEATNSSTGLAVHVYKKLEAAGLIESTYRRRYVLSAGRVTLDSAWYKEFKPYDRIISDERTDE